MIHDLPCLQPFQLQPVAGFPAFRGDGVVPPPGAAALVAPIGANIVLLLQALEGRIERGLLQLKFAAGHGGQLFWKTGAVFASSDCIEIHIHGKGGHASTPFLAINPILIAAEIINSLQGLVSRESTYNVPAVLTVTGITAGNGAYNIIPNSATIVGGLRTQSLEVRSHLLKRMEEISKQCAAMYGATAEMKVPSGCPPVINDPTMTADFITAAKKVFPAEDILELDHSSMGGEDSSYFFTEVPGCYAFLYNSIPSDDGKEYPHHNGRFCIDDSVLYLASAVFAQAVADQICK